MTSTSNENSTKAMMMKRDSLLADDLDNFDPSDLDLEEDEWRDVFDNVAPPENADPSESSESLLMPPPADKKKEGAMSGCTESPGLLGESKRRKRTAAQLEREDKTAQAPPTWHSTEADLQHRQTMVQDIQQLLIARKKNNPDNKWLERLPVKARMLETQLYKSASSLEAYLDRKTLKNRLGKLASAITSHYKEAVSSRRSSTRSSSSSIISQSSLGSLENSFSAARLRRSSAESLPSSSSFAPTTKLRREQSEPAIPSSSPTTKFLTKLRPEQSDTVVPSAKTISSTSESSVANASLNVPGNGRLPDMNVALVQNAPVSGVSSGNINPMAQQQRIANEQLQQQMLATMRQQQNIANQLKPNNAQQIMAAQAAMMGGNNGMVMMNQLQQQQNALNLNLMQQQALFQQRQQMLMASGNLPNNNGMNNMVNVSLPNVIPGEGAGNFQNFNNLMVSSDNTSMPPPTALRNVNANTPRRTPGGNDESSPLSPNSFRW